MEAKLTSILDYTKPKKYTVEALIIFVSATHSATPSDPFQLWLVLGVVLRIAMRMGYHREPSHYPAISPFEGEMRRRLWYLMFIYDVLTSFSVGLPAMMRQMQWDTRSPTNLADTDFDVDTKELPPARPLDEIHPVTYGIIKSRLAFVFARAAEISHAVEPPDYKDVQALDEEMDLVHAELPLEMKITSIGRSVLDTPSTIFHRFKLELMYQKTKCTLHRRYMTDHIQGTDEEKSRKVCVEAAMKILTLLDRIYHASQQGGQLSSSPLILNALNSHDFLLAVMVLCLELSKLSKLSPEELHAQHDEISALRGLLESTHRIYTTTSKFFSPPEKAVKAMEVMIKRIRELGKYNSFLRAACRA
jgi:hypothetical protein